MPKPTRPKSTAPSADQLVKPALRPPLAMTRRFDIRIGLIEAEGELPTMIKGTGDVEFANSWLTLVCEADGQLIRRHWPAWRVHSVEVLPADDL